LPPTIGGINIRKYVVISSLIMVVLLVILSQSTVFASYGTPTSSNSINLTNTEKYSGVIPENLFPSGFYINQSYYNASLKAYVDPVFAQVNDMRAKGFTDDSIVAELKKQNITFNPKRNEWVNGTPMTPLVNPYRLSRADDEISSWHSTNNYIYSGFTNTLYPGNMELYGDGYTHTNYLTTHIGTLGVHWAEAGIAHWTSGYYVFTYDNLYTPDQWYTIPTNPGVSHTVNIFIWNVYDSGLGYVYTVTLDGNLVRAGHLDSTAYQVYQNNEIFKNSADPSYTNNAYSNLVYNQHLYRLSPTGQQQNILWNENTVSTSNGDGGYPSWQSVSTDSYGTTQVYTWVDY
jgi:hypothetical protein